jgi:hypothetical protein
VCDAERETAHVHGSRPLIRVAPHIKTLRGFSRFWALLAAGELRTDRQRSTVPGDRDVTRPRALGIVDLLILVHPKLSEDACSGYPVGHEKVIVMLCAPSASEFESPTNVSRGALAPTQEAGSHASTSRSGAEVAGWKETPST